MLGVGDILKTGSPQLCALFNYGNADCGLFAFPPGGNNWQQVWRSGPNTWAWEATMTEFSDPAITPTPPPPPGPQPPPSQTGCLVSEPGYDEDGDFEGYDTYWADPCPYTAHEMALTEFQKRLNDVKGNETQGKRRKGPRIVVFPSDSSGTLEGLPKTIAEHLLKGPLKKVPFK